MCSCSVVNKGIFSELVQSSLFIHELLLGSLLFWGMAGRQENNARRMVVVVMAGTPQTKKRKKFGSCCHLHFLALESSKPRSQLKRWGSFPDQHPRDPRDFLLLSTFKSILSMTGFHFLQSRTPYPSHKRDLSIYFLQKDLCTQFQMPIYLDF